MLRCGFFGRSSFITVMDGSPTCSAGSNGRSPGVGSGSSSDFFRMCRSASCRPYHHTGTVTPKYAPTMTVRKSRPGRHAVALLLLLLPPIVGDVVGVVIVFFELTEATDMPLKLSSPLRVRTTWTPRRSFMEVILIRGRMGCLVVVEEMSITIPIIFVRRWGGRRERCVKDDSTRDSRVIMSHGFCDCLARSIKSATPTARSTINDLALRQHPHCHSQHNIPETKNHVGTG